MDKQIRQLRDILGLSQTAFGERLGISRDAVNNLEHGRAEIKEPIIKLICSEFHVDYIWLTTGAGDSPFIKSDDSFYEKLDRVMANETDIRKNLFKALLDAPDEDLAALEKWIDFCADLKKES